MRTRVAPTPSGYLHAGNAVNALLVSWLARQHDGVIALRIDDADGPRYRREYVDDLLAVLSWLGIAWSTGPRTTAEFESDYSQSLKRDYYREELERARDRGLPAFACSCTRSRALAVGRRGCVGDCRDGRISLVPGESALRADIPGVEDVVLWRRDDLPAYHLASVIDDRDLGTTHVVRGQDLVEATLVQARLAPYLDADGFANATFLHHALLTDPEGRKLSKSQLGGGPLERSDQVRDRIRAAAVAIGAPLGVVAPSPG